MRGDHVKLYLSWKQSRNLVEVTTLRSPTGQACVCGEGSASGKMEAGLSIWEGTVTTVHP